MPINTLALSTDSMPSYCIIERNASASFFFTLFIYLFIIDFQNIHGNIAMK